MDHQQLLIRIKSFLNSTELLDSPTSQELFSAYRELTNGVAKRLIECFVLLQKKQKIEALALAQQSPNLMEVLHTVLCPEQKELLALAQLYDWPLPDPIDLKACEALKKAFSEMEDLRPLLTEFRRIARTDQVENKLHLLLEISRIDKDNPEWRLPLSEVENQYLSKLIAEAQETIGTQDFDRLEEIHEELKNTPWIVTVPTIVLQKIEKLVADHKREMARKEAIVILEKIASALGAFDVAGVDDALVCWREHCEKSHYEPQENELRQQKEAEDWLQSEKKKREEQQKLQLQMERILAEINAMAPLAQVESLYAEARTSGLEIPEYVTHCVEKYRQDVERAWRTASIIRGLKIAGTVLIILAVLTGGALWTFQYLLENSQYKNLEQLLREKDLVKAQSTLKDIETRYPRLANRPKISKARAELLKMEKEENARREEFTRLTGEIESLLKVYPPDPLLKTKVDSLVKSAASREEKERADSLRLQIERTFERRANQVEEVFMKKIDEVRRFCNETQILIRQGNLKEAEKVFTKVEKAMQEIDKLQEVDKELLSSAQKILEQSEEVRQQLGSQKRKDQEFRNTLNAILTADTFDALVLSVQKFSTLLDRNLNQEELRLAENFRREVSCYNAIRKHQGQYGTEIPADFETMPYFLDKAERAAYLKKSAEAGKNLKSRLQLLKANVNRQNILQIQLMVGTDVLDLYVSDRGYSFSDDRVIFKQHPDKTRITIRKTFRDQVKIRYESGTETEGRLIHPGEFRESAFLKSRAGHQQLISRLYSACPNGGEKSVLIFGIQALKEIKDDPLCAPYWKMRLSLDILNAIMPLDLSQNKALRKIDEELKKLQELDNESKNPLNNPFLTEKIRGFYKTFDFSGLDLSLRQNQFMLKFADDFHRCRFVCVGAAWKVDSKLECVFFSAFKKTPMEVFCFNDDRSAILLIGQCGPDGLIFNDGCQAKTAGHLLFTMTPAHSVSRLYKDVKQNQSGIDPEQMNWPKFWPQNMKGGTK